LTSFATIGSIFVVTCLVLRHFGIVLVICECIPHFGKMRH
jgi:hypothetical protein